MADKKKNILSESDKQRNVWKKAEKLITQNKAEDALLILRELDESGSHQTTLRLAGKATHKSLNKQMPNLIIARLLHFLEIQ